MSLEELGIEPPQELSEGWQLEANGVERLATAIGTALAQGGDEAMLPFVPIAAELESAGNDDYSRLVIQALLVRLTRKEITRDSDVSALLFNSAAYIDMLDELLQAPSPGSSLLLAATLTLAGRVAMATSDYQLAIRTFEGAASVWTELDLPTQLAPALLSQSAALHYLGKVEDAERVGDRAYNIFEMLGDDHSRAMLSLNRVQNALAKGDVDTAQARLDAVSELVWSLRDGHLSASYLLNQAAIHIELERWDDARGNYLRAATSARRRGDLRQFVVAAKNLAKLHAEHFRTTDSSAWWRKARDAAHEAHDWREEQSAERSLGVQLADEHLFSDSLGAFQRALDLNATFGDALAAAQSRADLGAVLLSWAGAERRRGDDEMSSILLDRARETLTQARSELEEQGDFDWAETTVRNLRSVWALGNLAKRGVSEFRETAERFAEAEPDYSAELLRNAALLDLETAIEPNPDAVEWLETAAARQTLPVDQKAWALANDAATIFKRFDLDQEAVRLFDAALTLLNRSEQATSWGNIQNDAALAAASSGANADAERRLHEVEALARETQNRVLLALATLNLGELAMRSDRNEDARISLVESASLFETLGDVDNASGAWASVSNVWVKEDEPESAIIAANKALALANISESGDSLARAYSAEASIRYLNGDFEGAYALWLRSASLVVNRHEGEYQALALDSLANLSDWRRFRRALDRLAGQAQRHETQLSFVEKLHLAGLTWLRQGRPRAAGVVLAYIVLLNFDGVMKSSSGRSEGRYNPRQLVKLGPALGAVRAYFSLLDLPSATLRALRREYELTVRRIAGDSAESLLTVVDDFALRDDDESS